MRQTALGGTLRNRAFVTAQAKAILQFHLLHTQWSPACLSSGMWLFHRQAAHWMAKDKGPCSASRVRAGLWEADRSSAAQAAFWLWPTPFFRIPKIALIKSSRLTGNTLLHVVTATVPARLLPQSVSWSYRDWKSKKYQKVGTFYRASTIKLYGEHSALQKLPWVTFVVLSDSKTQSFHFTNKYIFETPPPPLYPVTFSQCILHHLFLKISTKNIWDYSVPHIPQHHLCLSFH